MPPTPHDHDRITMPSRRADGTLDQTAPELIGPVTDALAGITHQVQSQAVAAQDDDQDTTAVEAAQVQAREDAEAEVAQLHPDARDQGAATPTDTAPDSPVVQSDIQDRTLAPTLGDSPVGPFGTEPVGYSTPQTPDATPSQGDASPVVPPDDAPVDQVKTPGAFGERTPGPDA